jgi:YHS domain-containing protein
MNIDILYTEDCPNYPFAVALVNEVVKELNLEAEIQEVLVRGPEEARSMHFLGSPSIQVNWVDIEPGASERTDFAFACRTYGGEGIPPRTMLLAAITGESAPAAAIDEESSVPESDASVASSAHDPKVILTPVCPGCLSSLVRLGMHKTTSVAHNYAGREYYFCSRGCVDIFERDAERYLLELKDLVVCPVCLGERYQRSATYVAVEESVYFTCRSPRCGELLKEDPDFYFQRLAGKVSSAGVKDHDGCSLG